MRDGADAADQVEPERLQEAAADEQRAPAETVDDGAGQQDAGEGDGGGDEGELEGVGEALLLVEDGAVLRGEGLAGDLLADHGDDDDEGATLEVEGISQEVDGVAGVCG